jgi:photosystem II stability/assembly factor-like uncharacterized protein
MILLVWIAACAQAQPSQWQPRGMGGGGALYQPGLNPAQAGEWYIACDMGDMFHSQNGGQSWTNVDFRQLVGGTRGRVEFTGDPALRYALTARGPDAAEGTWLTRSTDGGQSWTLVAGDPAGGDAYFLAVDYDHPARLLISDYTRLFFSANGGNSFQPVATNGGGLFVAGAFFRGDTLLVGTSNGLLVSSNGGQSFAVEPFAGLPAGDVFLALTGAAQNNGLRLAALTGHSADVYPGMTGADYGAFSGLYTLDYPAGNWQNRSAALPANSQPMFIGMARGDVNTIWAAGYNGTTYAPGVWKSTDGGSGWTQTFVTANNQNIATGYCGHGGDVSWGWAETALGFAVSPADPLRAVITDYGFAHATVDGGVHWRQIYLSPADQNPENARTPKRRAYHSVGLEPTSCWSVLWVDSTRLVASYTDIVGARSTDGGASWSKPAIDTSGTYSVNTIYQVVKDPVSGKLYAATSSVHDLYQSTYLTDSRINGGRGQIWSSPDSGRSWQMIHDFQHPVVALTLDPNNPQHALASVVHSTLGGIFTTSDLQNGSAAVWTRLALPPRTEGHPHNVHLLNDGTLVCTYSARRAGSPQAFTPSSGVFVSTDGGTSWIDRSDPLMVYWTKDLTLDPFDPSQNSWFVAVHRGWGGAPNEMGGLFHTTNRGLNWTRINSTNLYAESCTPSPLDSNQAYLTTETDGLLYCGNLRAPAPVFAPVMSYPFMHPLRVFFSPYHRGEVWVTSFGNGIKVGSADAPLPAVDNLTVYSTGAGVTLRWSAVPGAQGYRIEGSSTLDFASVTVLGTTAESSFAVPAADGLQFFRVVATDQAIPRTLSIP